MARRILRKRMIPDEVVDISGDELLFWGEHGMITRWRPIRPRKDIGWGISYTSFQEHYKISAFYDKQGNFLYWYCDVVSVFLDEATDTLLIKDLLLDVRWIPGEDPEVLDRDELSFAREQGLVTEEECKLAEATVERLLAGIQGLCFPPPRCCLQDYGPPESFS